VTSQITQLTPLKLKEPFEITIHFKLVLTMADGKVWNALTDTSSMTCYICKVKPNDLKKFDRSNHQINESVLSITVREWRIVGKLKEEFGKRKQYIQEQLHQRLGIIVDVPKQGCGNTNDGNTARRFFKDPTLLSEIIGVNENLIYRFSILLKVISLGLEIDSTKFGKYCQETAELHRKLYEWYPLPPSIHKLLDHGEVI
ncbi:hypothetical protein EAG_02325, partial [Camponotus floridanus]